LSARGLKVIPESSVRGGRKLGEVLFERIQEKETEIVEF
jgi:hypothetical protein